MLMPEKRSEPYQHKNEGWIHFKYATANRLRKIPWLWNPLHWIWRVANICAVKVLTLPQF